MRSSRNKRAYRSNKSASTAPWTLSLDSLDRVSIAFDLEEKYDIEIPEEKLGQIKTVNDMVTGIEEAVRQKSAKPSATA